VLAGSVGDTAAVGRPKLASNLQTLAYVGGRDQAAFGTAYADFRVRTLAPLFPPDGFPVPEPTVGFAVREIAPEGFDPSRFPGAIVEEHFTVVALHGRTWDGFGEPALRNGTPEVHPYPWESDEFGRAGVANYTRYLAMDGMDPAIHGRLAVGERTQHVQPMAIAPPEIGQRHKLQKLLEDPPGPQTVYPAWPDAELRRQVGELAVTADSLFPAGFDAAKYGAAGVRLMGVTGVGGIYLADEDQYGTCWVRGPQRVDLEERGVAGELFGKARLSPTTLRPEMFVGYAPANEDEDKRFGLFRVYIGGNLGPEGSEFAKYGAARITLARRTVVLAGFKAQKFGVPYIPRDVFPLGRDLAEFGDMAVGFKAEAGNTLTAGGLDGAGIGTPWVAGWVQPIAPEGIEEAAFGTARLHPPEPIQPEGFEAALFGTAWISWRVRPLALDGFDALRIDAEPGHFAERLRVHRGQPLMPAGFKSFESGLAGVSNWRRNIGMKGFDAARVSRVKIHNHIQYLRAFSASRWIDPPTFHAVKYLSRIGVDGMDSEEIGEMGIANE
jgi:hypothetical protein